MPDREKSDHWDLLASDLGAEIPDEGGSEEGVSAPQEIESGEITPPDDSVECEAEPTVSAAEAEISAPMASEPEVRVPRAPTNWGELAAKLGVEVREEPVEAVVDERGPPEPDTAEPDTAEPDTAEPDTAEPDTAEPDTDPRQAFEPDEPAETPPLLVEEAEESTPVARTEEPDEPALPKAEPVAADRDVESTASDAEPAESKSGRRRRRRRRRPRGAEADEPTETPEELSKAAFAEGLFDLVDAEPTTVEASGDEPSKEQSSSGEEAAPGRTKRRRRRGSGRKKAAAKKETISTEAGERTSVDEAAELTDQPADAPPGDEVERSDRDIEDEPAKGAKMSHRGIPTWAEAIDIIISTNMEDRAKRPGGGSGRSRGGRKRGGRPKSSEKAS